jgi:hypothetical protein
MRIFAMLIVLTLIAANAMADAPAKTASKPATHTNKLTPTSCPSPDTERDKQSNNYYLSGSEIRQLLNDHNPSLLEYKAQDVDEVIVTADPESLPMRDEAHDIPANLTPLVWAAAHPTQSWRILFPIRPE